ncbi:MAG: phage minor head protein, partial [Candidatus Bathyarchaeia archaeon]
SSRWQYVAVVDERTCEQCLSHDGMIYSWEEVEQLFPNISPVDEDTYDVNMHPNCRCQLVKVAEGVEEGGEKPVGFLFWTEEGVEAPEAEVERYSTHVEIEEEKIIKFPTAKTWTTPYVYTPRLYIPRPAGVPAPLWRVARYPIRYGIRYGMRYGLQYLAAFMPELAAMMPLLISQLMPIIQAIIQEYVKREAVLEMKRQMEEYEKKRAQIYREIYRMAVGE